MMIFCEKQNRAIKVHQASRLVSCVVAFLVTGTLSGCSYIVLLGYLIGGPPSIAPDFEVQTKKSLSAKDVTVAVVCYAPTEVKWKFDSIDDEIGKYVSYRLHQNHISVINPDRIRAWMDENPEWDRPEEIGAAFNTDYVIYIDVHQFSLYEKGSSNLYRGRSEMLLSVFELDATGYGDKIYSKEVTSEFPLKAPRSTYETKYTTFKRQYLSRLSEEIGRLFYEYYSGDDIPDAT